MSWEPLLWLVLGLAFLAIGSAVVRRYWRTDDIYPWERGLLYVGGRFERVLEPGRHSGLNLGGRRVERLQVANHIHRGLFDVLSADRLPYRLNAMVAFDVADPRAYFENAGRQAVSNAVERAVADVAATRTLDEALNNRIGLHAALAEALATPIAGARITEAAIMSLVLPPELRRAYAETERAKHEAAAALERARGEQASLRSLANAARMLKDNPELLNLRMLQAVSTGKGASLVLGDGALAQPGRKAR